MKRTYIAISIALAVAICGCTFTEFFKDSQATAVTITEKAPVVADAAVTGIEALDKIAGAIEGTTGKKLDESTADKLLGWVEDAKGVNDKAGAGISTVKAVTGDNSYVSAGEAVSTGIGIVLGALIAFMKNRKTINTLKEAVASATSEPSETK